MPDQENIENLGEFTRKLNGTSVIDVDKIYEAIHDRTLHILSQYEIRKSRTKRNTRIFRRSAYFFGSVGAIFPVSQPMISVFYPETKEWFLSLGYVFVAIAGAMIAGNKFLSGSNAYARYTICSMSLEKRFSLFSIDWCASKKEDKIKLAQIYIDDIYKIIGGETDNWKAALEEANDKHKLPENNTQSESK